MKYIDYKDLRQKLQNHEITWLEAYDKIINSTTKPWDTKEWKEKRPNFIGTECVMCGRKNGDPCTKGYYEYLLQHSGEPIERPTVHLVLQHSWHPDTIDHLCKNITYRYKDEYDSYFRQTVYTKGPNNILIRNIDADELKHIHKKLSVKFIDEKYPELGLEAIYKYLDQFERYMSMKDTSTYCNNCAEREDMVDRSICPLCKDIYISNSSACCYECKDTEEGQRLSAEQEKRDDEISKKYWAFLEVIEIEEDQLHNKYFNEPLTNEEKELIKKRLEELENMKNNSWDYIEY